MNDLLIRGIQSNRNDLITSPKYKNIPCHKKKSSVEKKNINSSNIGNSNIYSYNNLDKFNHTNKSAINMTKKINNKIIKLNNDINNWNNHRNTNIQKGKTNDTSRIKLIFNNDKSKTFNRQSSSPKIKVGTNIHQNKNNQISNNSKNKERNKDEICKKKFLIIDNNNTSDIQNEKNNTQNFVEEIKYKNFKRNTDGLINLEKKITHNDEPKKIKDKEKTNKVKEKLNKDKDKNLFNHTINLKNNELYKINSKNNFENIIFQSNSLHNNINNNYEGLLKKRKNIDINTEYQTNPTTNTFSPENNLFNNLNNTTSKVKLKSNNYIEMDKDKDFIHLTENTCILKTKSKSKAKIKLENKKDPEIEIRIIEPNKNENIIFNNRKLQIPTKNSKTKNNEINKNFNEENNLNNNNVNEKYKLKNSCVKVKKTQNQNDQINRNNTYNNNESSFFTTNINTSNIEENNNEYMPMHDLGNYQFVNNTRPNENTNNNNINNNGINNDNNQNNEYNNNNITKKIHNVKVCKSNSNTNKNVLFQNFPFFNENKNCNNILTLNNYSNSNTGNTSNNIFNQNNNTNNNLNSNINIKNKIENSNIEITNRKNETQNIKEKGNNEEFILIDEKIPKDTDEIINKSDKKDEIIKDEILNKKNIEEIKEKEIPLDKSTSLRVFPVAVEDFIEKEEDEFIKLLEPQTSMDNKKNIDNNIHQTKEEDESEIIIQNSEFSILNDYSKYNYNINNINIYQNVNVFMNYNNSNKANVNYSNNNPNINLENITMKDTSVISNIGIKGCKSITQAGKERTGHRKKNQDNCIMEKNLNNIQGFNLFAVLDGHGENGHIVSQLASKYLIKKFTNISKNYIDNETLYNFLKLSDFQKIIDIFMETDNEIIHQKNLDISLSGTTCVLVIQLGEHLICSNIGDSRAILIYEENNENKIFELSHDSKPDVPEEKKRINIMGGRVDKITDENGEKTGPYRVYMKNTEQPGLAMSRSFGDKKAKSCGVIPYPDIIEFNLNNNDSKYMVICSDGVWEFLSNEEVMNIGNKYFAQNNMNDFCNELLKKSTELWENEDNYMDDITIVTVFF